MYSPPNRPEHHQKVAQGKRSAVCGATRRIIQSRMTPVGTGIGFCSCPSAHSSVHSAKVIGELVTVGNEENYLKLHAYMAILAAARNDLGFIKTFENV
ncbi:hypothetical protein TYRP_008480 [Tyrophagus putrescentiae]|nr:hypothetical protein TYRP_008480 [Tyrophagus putrescentiae]